MSQNPLQQFFRQPKIYISFPSQGAYTKPGVFQGEPTNVPVYGMTGMDEIIIKTPDALLNGESTVKVIESCCPVIKDAWGLNNLDVDIVLTAIRIATYGNNITVGHKCEHCGTDNEYELDMGKLIEHFGSIQYDNKVVLKDLVIKLQPLTYRQVTDYSIRNFQLQQQLKQVETLQDEAEKKAEMAKLFAAFGELQTQVYLDGIESIEAGTRVVNERSYIAEWAANTEKSVFDQIRKKIDENREKWRNPPQVVVCDECKKENTINVELDNASFFAIA